MAIMPNSTEVQPIASFSSVYHEMNHHEINECDGGRYVRFELG